MQIERFNENELIRQTLAGDTSAFDRLVKTYRTTIYMLVLSYIKNPADAEDLTQRIFIRAYERLATLRDLNCFLPWLQRIAQNTCKNWLHRQMDSTTNFEALTDTDFATTVPSPEEVVLKAEIESIVREAIGALQETDRKLMQARYIEGASYDQLQVESGLSYAAIANRLKRAKQEMRRRIDKLLGGMAVLPGRTLIWGGIETVKLSVKTKLAAVGVAAVLGIGGGGVVYHHTSESNPVSEYRSVAVNKQEGSEAQAVPGDSSPPTGHQTDATVNSNAPLDGAGDQANRLSTDTKVVGGVQIKGSIPGEVLIEIDGKLIFSNGKVVEAVKAVIGSELAEDMLAQLPVETPQVITDLGGSMIGITVEGGLDLKPGDHFTFESEEMNGVHKFFFQNQSTTADTPSDATELMPQPTDSVLPPSADSTVESPSPTTELSEGTATLSAEDWAEFEKLVSDFSDEDWAEFERLLRAVVGGEPPQQNKQRSLAPKPQRQQQVIENVGEKTPITPSVLQELRKQLRVPIQRDTKVPPRPKDAERNRER